MGPTREVDRRERERWGCEVRLLFSERVPGEGFSGSDQARGTVYERNMERKYQ